MRRFSLEFFFLIQIYTRISCCFFRRKKVLNVRHGDRNLCRVDLHHKMALKTTFSHLLVSLTKLFFLILRFYDLVSNHLAKVDELQAKYLR